MWDFTGANALLPWQRRPAVSRLKDSLLPGMSQGSPLHRSPHAPKEGISSLDQNHIQLNPHTPPPHKKSPTEGEEEGRLRRWCGRHTVISPFMALLISSQEATINIELLPCCSLQVGTHLSHPWPGWGERGAVHAFIIKVSWDALQHLEVWKQAFLREYAGIAPARKPAPLPADDLGDGAGVGVGRSRIR